MKKDIDFWGRVKKIQNSEEFESAALELFNYQSVHVDVYRKFLEGIRFNKHKINTVKDIPFLPVELFKSQIILDTEIIPETCFISSGTTGSVLSKHYVVNSSIYDESLMSGFKQFYGDPSQYIFLALLPSYLDRPGSSLVYMADKIIKATGNNLSGFYLNNIKELSVLLETQKNNDKKIFLMGVSFALLDLFENYPVHIPDAIIMETGGMKGRRKEMIREELHNILKIHSGVNIIHSEYGMTELLSQGYSKGEGVFQSPPWMKILTHDIYDPFRVTGAEETGTVSVIDLANIHSCAFISTKDIGRVNREGSYEILGRMDNSDIRGCNLLIS